MTTNREQEENLSMGNIERVAAYLRDLHAESV